MYFGLSENQLMLQDSVRRYLEDNADLEQLRNYVEGDVALAQKLHGGLLDLGVHLTLLPEAHGGLGMGILEAALIQQMLGRYVAPSGFASAYALAVVGLEAATPEQQADWLGRIANGAVVMGVGLTEATGAREQSGLILTGEKAAGRASFVMTSENATHFMLTAGDDLLIVARDDKTISQSALVSIDKTRQLVTLDLQDTPCVVLGGNQAAATQAKMIAAGRVLLAADILGAAEAMLEKAVAYAKEREQFNRPIGSFQAVKHLCAEMAARLEPCRALLWYAAYAQNHMPEEAALMACLLKSHLAETGKFIARTATEVHGGMGFTDLLGLHYWFKRIGANRQLLGGVETTRATAAKLQDWVG